MTQELSRRSFLMGATTLGAAALAVGAFAAAPEVAHADEDDAAASDGAVSATYDCDFVVCGSGTTGLCAATRAAELGAKVILVDPITENGVGGNSRYVENIGNVAMGTDNALENVGATDHYYDGLASYHRYASNAIVTRRYADDGEKVRAWTTDFQGVTYNEKGKYDHGPDGMSGGLYAIMTMYQLAQDLGVQFLFDARAYQLLTNESGAVTGVLCKSRTGEITQVNAKAVDLCTGGFSANGEMFERFTNVPYERVIARGTMGTQRGDGIAMGEELNAQLHHPEAINYCSPILPGHYNKGALTICGANQADTIFLNQDGRRFCDESVIKDWTLSGNIGSQQQHIFAVIDQAFVEKIMTEGVVTRRANYFEPGDPVPQFQEEIDKALVRENPRVVKADTIEELAEKLGIDPAATKAEVEKYNSYCDGAYDHDFLKAAEFLRKMETPPFYGFKTVLAFYNTVGGLKVDEYARVIDHDFKPIPGLYAGGSDAGALFGPYYDVSCAPGSTQLWARVSGYWAADHAVNEYFPTL
ncbi:MAG: FAD-binding protein [Adlercreutzia sp.]|nr:FAD-binding protein [Adlercreutzia sp.]